MNIKDLKLFDHYSFTARLLPALLTMLPLAFGIFASAGTVALWYSNLWIVFVAAGGTYALAAFAGSVGKHSELELWRSWGGTPTTQLLRYSGPANAVLRHRWHIALSTLLDRPMPTQQLEITDPTGADQAYEAAVKVLIENTRDRKAFPLVYKENVNYGFARNLHALKTGGIISSILGVVSTAAASVWFIHIGKPQLMPWVCTGISVLLLLGWLFVVKPSWVKIFAFAYAERLLASTEHLKPKRKDHK